jgi:hypothetical protein
MNVIFTNYRIYGFFLAVLGIMASCTAPRTVYQSGKVTPHQEIKVGASFLGNFATQPLFSVTDATRNSVNLLSGRDTINYDESINDLAEAALAYTLDPITPNYDFYIRYGLLNRMDVGYKFTGGAHSIDAMYQFLGSTGTWANPGPKGIHGSIGIQYSGQQLNLPGGWIMGRAQRLLGFRARRRDIMIPLVLSVPFGREEEYGNLSFGVVYNHSFIRYGYTPSRIVEQAGMNRVPLEPFVERENYGSWGGFINAKFGYRYIYFVPALSVFYQNYGTYQLFRQQTTTLSGWTFIPSIGVQIHLAPARLRNRQK